MADDHPIFLRGLVDLIETDGSFEIVCKASDGRQALDAILEHKPVIALLDLSMPELTGFEVMKEAHKKRTKTDFMILTAYKERGYFNEAIDAGVKGYIPKENTEDELLEGLNAVANGKYYISPTLTEYLIEREKELHTFTEENPAFKLITPTERDVLKLISESYTNKEIASQMCISHKTVENHRTNIKKKLGLEGRNQIFLFAYKNKHLL